jgi:hypothetical protein
MALQKMAEGEEEVSCLSVWGEHSMQREQQVKYPGATVSLIYFNEPRV